MCELKVTDLGVDSGIAILLSLPSNLYVTSDQTGTLTISDSQDSTLTKPTSDSVADNPISLIPDLDVLPDMTV